ncbi:hypothetical protein Hanom_Chr06g00512061 [Helianthus anomalus]
MLDLHIKRVYTLILSLVQPTNKQIPHSLSRSLNSGGTNRLSRWWFTAAPPLWRRWKCFSAACPLPYVNTPNPHPLLLSRDRAPTIGELRPATSLLTPPSNPQTPTCHPLLSVRSPKKPWTAGHFVYPTVRSFNKPATTVVAAHDGVSDERERDRESERERTDSRNLGPAVGSFTRRSASTTVGSCHYSIKHHGTGDTGEDYTFGSAQTTTHGFLRSAGYISGLLDSVFVQAGQIGYGFGSTELTGQRVRVSVQDTLSLVTSWGSPVGHRHPPLTKRYRVRTLGRTKYPQRVGSTRVFTARLRLVGWRPGRGYPLGGQGYRALPFFSTLSLVRSKTVKGSLV